MKEWIKFEFLTSTGKTKVWEVVPIAGDGRNIGSVKWFGRWRTYAFFPFPGCAFEKDCLRVIAQFCEDQTKEHRRWNRESRAMIRKGRKAPTQGEYSGTAKLSNEGANRVRQLFNTGHFSQQELADAFNIDRAAISRIVNNKSYGGIQ